MDEVTRPKRAARYRRSTSTIQGDEAETDEESLPSSARQSDASDESGQDASSGEDSREVIREPDPKATRHSTRPSKAKTVNYSTKHHPQDYRLPGFQHKARMQKESLKRARRSRSSPLTSAQSPLDAINVTNEEDADAENLDHEATGGETTIEAPTNDAEPDRAKAERSQPLKRLRVLKDDRERGNGKKSKKTKSSSESAKNKEAALSDSTTESFDPLADITQMVDEATEASERLIEQLGGLSSSPTRNVENFSDKSGFVTMNHSDAHETDESELNVGGQVHSEGTAEPRRDSFDVFNDKAPTGSLLVPYYSSSDFEEQLAITETRDTGQLPDEASNLPANPNRVTPQDPGPTKTFDAETNNITRSSSVPSTQRSNLGPGRGENIASNTKRSQSTFTSITSYDPSHQEPQNDVSLKHTAIGTARQHLTNNVEGTKLAGLEKSTFADSFSGIPAADTDDELLNSSQ